MKDAYLNITIIDAKGLKFLNEDDKCATYV